MPSFTENKDVINTIITELTARLSTIGLPITAAVNIAEQCKKLQSQYENLFHQYQEISTQDRCQAQKEICTNIWHLQREHISPWLSQLLNELFTTALETLSSSSTSSTSSTSLNLSDIIKIYDACNYIHTLHKTFVMKLPFNEDGRYYNDLLVSSQATEKMLLSISDLIYVLQRQQEIRTSIIAINHSDKFGLNEVLFQFDQNDKHEEWDLPELLKALHLYSTPETQRVYIDLAQCYINQIQNLSFCFNYLRGEGYPWAIEDGILARYMFDQLMPKLRQIPNSTPKLESTILKLYRARLLSLVYLNCVNQMDISTYENRRTRIPFSDVEFEYNEKFSKTVSDRTTVLLKAVKSASSLNELKLAITTYWNSTTFPLQNVLNIAINLMGFDRFLTEIESTLTEDCLRFPLSSSSSAMAALTQSVMAYDNPAKAPASAYDQKENNLYNEKTAIPSAEAIKYPELSSALEKKAEATMPVLASSTSSSTVSISSTQHNATPSVSSVVGTVFNLSAAPSPYDTTRVLLAMGEAPLPPIGRLPDTNSTEETNVDKKEGPSFC